MKRWLTSQEIFQNARIFFCPPGDPLGFELFSSNYTGPLGFAVCSHWVCFCFPPCGQLLPIFPAQRAAHPDTTNLCVLTSSFIEHMSSHYNHCIEHRVDSHLKRLWNGCTSSKLSSLLCMPSAHHPLLKSPQIQSVEVIQLDSATPSMRLFVLCQVKCVIELITHESDSNYNAPQKGASQWVMPLWCVFLSSQLCSSFPSKYMPMVVEPRPWAGAKTGGYLSLDEPVRHICRIAWFGFWGPCLANQITSICNVLKLYWVAELCRWTSMVSCAASLCHVACRINCLSRPVSALNSCR